MIHYGMTKTAQLAVARGLAETTAGHWRHGPTPCCPARPLEGVNEFVAKLRGGAPVRGIRAWFFEKVRPTSLLKRFAKVEEVAALVRSSPVAFIRDKRSGSARRWRRCALIV